MPMEQIGIHVTDSDNDSVTLGDSVKIIFGNGVDVNDTSVGDAEMYFDGTDVVFTAVTDGTSFKVTDTLTSRTTEDVGLDLSLTTDSTYITGTNMTWSGARGSSALKITGAYSGATGGYSNIYSNITSTGTIATGGNGVVAVKSVVTNSAAMTDGEMYAGMFIAKHSHATNDMGKPASLIGIEGWSYDASTGTVGTMIGGNFGYHNECTTTQETGSVHRGVQIFCDDAAGAQNATESQALCLWNMAGTQDDAIRVVQSGSGFTNMLSFSSASAAPVTVSGGTYTTAEGYITIKVGASTYRMPFYTGADS